MFRRAGFLRLGYNRKQVDAFFEVARVAYESGDPKLNSSRVRQVAFGLVRRGYDTKQVDAVLDRLERTYQMRERQEYIESRGMQAWKEYIGSRMQRVIDRMNRKPHRRFERERRTRLGYKPADVDRMLERILAYVQGHSQLSTEDLRSAVFRPAYGGYQQEHVDIYMDEVIAILLTLETL